MEEKVKLCITTKDYYHYFHFKNYTDLQHKFVFIHLAGNLYLKVIKNDMK